MGEGNTNTGGEVPGEGDHIGRVVETAKEIFEFDWIDSGGVEEVEDAVVVGELLMGGGGDGVKAGGDIPSEKVLGFDEATLYGEFIAAEGVGTRDWLVLRDWAQNEKGREGGGGLHAADDLGRVEGDCGLVVDKAVRRGEGGSGTGTAKGRVAR